MVGRTIFLVIVEKVMPQLGKVIVEGILWEAATARIDWVDSTTQQILFVDNVGGAVEARSPFPEAGGNEIYAAAGRFQHLRVPFSSRLILIAGEGGFNDVSPDHDVRIHRFHCLRKLHHRGTVSRRPDAFISLMTAPFF